LHLLIAAHIIYEKLIIEFLFIHRRYMGRPFLTAGKASAEDRSKLIQEKNSGNGREPAFAKKN
jgi:hypothetical protein